MLNKAGKLFLTATAISPLFFAYGLIMSLKGEILEGLCFIGGAALFLVFLLLILKCIKRKKNPICFSYCTITISDGDSFAFLLLYLMPLLTSLNPYHDWEIYVPVLLVCAVTIMQGYMYRFNPLMGMLGWHFYKVGTEEGVTHVLITRKRLLRKTDDTYGNLKVHELTEYVLIDMEKRK